jgi:hypothetical protein
VFLLILSLFVVTNAWTEHGVTQDGISMETRKVQGSAYESIRVSKASHVPPAFQAEVIWGPHTIEGVANRKNVRVHEVLEAKETSRVFYEVINAPLVSDRDFVMKSERRKDGEVYEIRFTTIDDPRRPPIAGKIRMRCEGKVVIEPDAGGGSIVTYEIFIDLAGALPAWLAKSSNRDATLAWIREMIERGAKKYAAAER